MPCAPFPLTFFKRMDVTLRISGWPCINKKNERNDFLLATRGVRGGLLFAHHYLQRVVVSVITEVSTVGPVPVSCLFFVNGLTDLPRRTSAAQNSAPPPDYHRLVQFDPSQPPDVWGVQKMLSTHARGKCFFLCKGLDGGRDGAGLSPVELRLTLRFDTLILFVGRLSM